MLLGGVAAAGGTRCRCPVVGTVEVKSWDNVHYLRASRAHKQSLYLKAVLQKGGARCCAEDVTLLQLREMLVVLKCALGEGSVLPKWIQIKP